MSKIVSKLKVVDSNYFYFYFYFNLSSFILFLELGLGLEWQDHAVTQSVTSDDMVIVIVTSHKIYRRI